MSGLRRSLSAGLLVVCMAVLGACGDSAGPAEDRVTTVQASSGDEQEATVGATLAQPVVVLALDAADNPVSGARVEFEVTSGGGTIAPASAQTDADGRASAEWTLGTTAGEQVVTAVVGMSSTTFSATATPGPAASLTVSPTPVVLDAIDATADLDIIAVDEHDNEIEGREPTWESLDPAIATVDETGIVTAVGPGTTEARATLDGVSDEAEVTVEPQAATIVVDPPTAQLISVGAMVQFEASALDANGHAVAVADGDYTWSSSDPDVVMVDATGLATAVANGLAQVRAAIGTIVGSAAVSVAQAAVTIEVTPSTDTLTTAEPTVQLMVDARDASDEPIPMPTVAWSSANTAIATVTQSGVVTGISNGVVVIRAVSGTAVDSATITVRLNTPPKAVADTRATAVNTSLVIAAPGLLANDTLGIPPGSIASFGGGSLGGTVATSPAGSTVTFGTGGSISVAANGSLSFVPSAGFMGAFTFMYRAQNAAGGTDATVTIHVGGAPDAVGDSYATNVNTTIVVPTLGVMANDDRASPLASVASFGGLDLGGSTVTTYAAGQRVVFGVGGFVGGSLQLDANGTLSFTPPTGFTGTFTFRYRLSNGVASSDATVTITVS